MCVFTIINEPGCESPHHLIVVTPCAGTSLRCGFFSRSCSYAKGIAGNRMGDVSRAWDGKTENKAGALGRVQGPSSPGSESTSTASGDDQTEAGLQRKVRGRFAGKSFMVMA